MAKARKPADKTPKKAKKPRGTHRTAAPDLSRQEIKFAQLLFDRHGTFPKKTMIQCFLEAGFPPKATDNATHVAAFRVVRKANFRQYYRSYQNRCALAAMATSTELLGDLINMVRADRRKLFGPDGSMLPPEEWPDDVAATVDDIAQDTVSEVDGTDIKQKVFVKRVKTVSRLAALVKALECIGALDPENVGKAEQKPLVVKGADPEKL